MSEQYDTLFIQLNIAEKIKLRDELLVKQSSSEIWNNPKDAVNINKQYAAIDEIVAPWQTLDMQLRDIKELLDLGDESLALEFESQIDAMESELNKLKKSLRFNGKYDQHAVLMRITAGVGGVDAQSFAQMLERMYIRWSEKSGFTSEIIERSNGEEAGIKTSVMRLEGDYAYGKLRSEHGVHRLVRLSPFNADNLRQTSFALVEVLPQIDAPEEVEINESDLKIDVYRSGGHGGQSVNTTDSAVRVTHIPTNIVIAIQNERSQIQNKETALSLLRSKLVQLQLEQHANSLSDLKAGESANWGSQIRNYVLHPYTLVKDTRTKYEEKDASQVLDGKIDGFIEAYLDSNLS